MWQMEGELWPPSPTTFQHIVWSMESAKCASYGSKYHESQFFAFSGISSKAASESQVYI